MSKAVKYAEKAVVYAAKGAWVAFERLNRISPNPSFTPKWSDKPLLKSYQKEKPPLGWPRTTDSLCPKCVPEIRQQILVERDSQKAIVLGRHGENLKRVGTIVRNSLPKGYYLDLVVKVAKDWQSQARYLDQFGI